MVTKAKALHRSPSWASTEAGLVRIPALRMSCNGIGTLENCAKLGGSCSPKGQVHPSSHEYVRWDCRTVGLSLQAWPWPRHDLDQQVLQHPNHRVHMGVKLVVLASRQQLSIKSGLKLATVVVVVVLSVV